MKTEKNIMIAFLLNILFSFIELIGGIITNSIAIISDAIHDFGDAISIGISYLLERISTKKPNNNYTYGYIRYSILGALITNIILLTGSILIVINAINRFINPVNINYNGMIILGIIGVIINFLAAYFTSNGDSLNQKAVNLHMIEDVLSWIIVLIGAIIIKFTQINRIDSILSIIVAIYILINSIKGLLNILNLFLEKTPTNINIEEIKENLLKIKGITNIHHIHIWSIDGINNLATMHIITNIKDQDKIKLKVKEELKKFKITHSTIEIESKDYKCDELNCHIEINKEITHTHKH